MVMDAFSFISTMMIPPSPTLREQSNYKQQLNFCSCYPPVNIQKDVEFTHHGISSFCKRETMVIPHLFVFPRVTSPSHVAPRWLPRCSPVTATSCRCTTSCCRGSAARPWSITWRRWRRRGWARRSGAPRSARPRMGGAT